MDRRALTSFGRADRIGYWISNIGDVIPIAPLCHSEFAELWLKNKGLAVSGDGAVEILIKDGWIRTQVFPDGDAFIQGTVRALKARGLKVLDVVPDFHGLEIGYVPFDYENPPFFSSEFIEKTPWNKVVDLAVNHREIKRKEVSDVLMSAFKEQRI